MLKDKLKGFVLLTLTAALVFVALVAVWKLGVLPVTAGF